MPYSQTTSSASAAASSLLADTRSSSQTPVVPPAVLQTVQGARQPPVTSGASSHADQTSSTTTPRLKDWTAEVRGAVDPIWPEYALPIEDIPPCTARDLGDRLGRLAQVQSASNVDVMYAVQPRDWSRTMRMRSSSPVWMSLIRSRWLVIETLAGHLELWDIEGSRHWNGVLGSFEIPVGSVDGAVVVEKAGEPTELFISTTGYQVHSFLLDLPYRGQQQRDAYTLAPISGFSGLKQKRNCWWAFARTEGSNNPGFLFVPHASTPLIRLACADEVAENQNVLDILLRDDIIVVARNQAVDLYSMSDALELLNTNQSGTSLPSIRIADSFSIPRSNFLHHTRLLHRAPAYPGPANGIFCSSFVSPDWIVSQIEKDDASGSTTPSSRYSLSGINYVGNGLGSPHTFLWGESGSRMIQVGNYALSMYFADPRKTHQSEEGTPNCSHVMAKWKIPRDIEDVPRCAAFDEATGIAVVGMHSGRISVADAALWVPPSPVPGDESDSSEYSVASPSGRKSLGIHPSPKRWPQISSNPALFYPVPLSTSEYPTQLAPGWFTDLEAFYPFANHPGYYGSIPWMVRELAGIPSESRCIIFSSASIDPNFPANNAVIELEVKVGNGGSLLLLTWSSESPLDFLLYQLRPDVTKDTVIRGIQEGEFPGVFCDDPYLSLNPLCIGQLAAWLFPHLDTEGESGLIKYDLVSTTRL